MSSPPSRPRPDYGLDAPGVVRNLLIVGAFGMVSLVTRLLGVWDSHSRVSVLGMPLITAGTTCLIVGLSMLYSSRIGKVRGREKYLDRLNPWRGDEVVLDIGCGRRLFLLAAAAEIRRSDRGTRSPKMTT